MLLKTSARPRQLLDGVQMGHFFCDTIDLLIRLPDGVKYCLYANRLTGFPDIFPLRKFVGQLSQLPSALFP